MGPGNGQYYSNSQPNHDQAQSNTQGYQQGYWYRQTNHAPTNSSHLQPVHGATSYQTPNENYAQTENNNATYRNRSQYETSSVLPSISSLNNDYNRISQAAGQTYGHSAQRPQAERQQDVSYQQSSYNASTHASYGQHLTQANRASHDSIDSGHSAPRTAPMNQKPVKQAQQYQAPRVMTPQQANDNATRPQWAPLSQGVRVESNMAPLSDHIAQAATAASTTPKNRQSVTHSQPNHPVPTTVDPHQVYDPHQEYQRLKKRQEEEAAAAQKQREIEAEAAREAEAEREVERQTQQALEKARKAETLTAAPIANDVETSAAKKKPRQRKSESAAGISAPKPRKSRKSAPVAPIDVDEPAQAAAMTLVETANAGNGSLEDQMKQMFRKMREFNVANPEMLARLWQQERDDYMGKDNPDAESSHKTPDSVPPKKSSSKIAGNTAPNKKSSSKTAASTAPTKNAAIQSTLLPSATLSLSPPATPMESSMPRQQAPSISTTIAKTSGTTWPADKKHQLAAAAAKLLLSMPANAGKVIDAAKIKKILDTNPSYLELCQTIESMGLQVNRRDFARGLISVVPDVDRAAQKPLLPPGQGTQPAGMQLSDITPMPSLNKSIAQSEAANAGPDNAAIRLVNGGSLIQSETPSKSTPKTTTPRARKEGRTARKPIVDAVSSSQANVPLSIVPESIDPQLEGLDAVKMFVDGQWQDQSQPHPNSPSTATKVKSARPSKPQARSSFPLAPLSKEEIARKRDFADLVDFTNLDSEEETAAPYYPEAKRHESEHPSALTQLMTPPQTDPEKLPSATGPARHLPIIPTLTQSQQQYPQALLPSSKPHPPHLSQVSTIIPPKVPADHPSRTIPMVQQIDKYKAIRRSSYKCKTIARDVLLACGRHPDMRHLNAHLEALKTAFTVDNTADLSTFRWDIADPGGPAPGSGAELPTMFDNIDISDDADDEEESDNEVPQRLAVQAAIVTNDGGAVVESLGSTSAGMKKMLPKHERLGGTKIRSHADHTQQPAGSTVRPHNSPAAPGSGYRALRALQSQNLSEDGQPVKKRGRPIGWRKWMMKDSTDPGSSKAQPTRGPKTPAKDPEPEPYYPVYKCEWRDCNAELHNLATLRKHVYKLHGGKPTSNGTYHCLWNGCGKPKAIDENGRTVSRFLPEEYGNQSLWREHVNKKHIEPIAWELGDGPAAGTLSEHDSDLSEAYMSDRQGRRVTPAVVIPSPAAIGAAAAAAAGSPLAGGRPISAVERRARQLQHQAEKRKREMGPGIDKGGARLANEQRRAGFVDDDDTEMIVGPED